MTTNLNLHDFNKNTSLLEIKRLTTPQEYARVLRGFGKIFYWDAARFYVITDHALGKEALRSPALSADRGSFFVSRMPNLDMSLITNFFSVVRKMMVMADGEAHERQRKAASMGIDGALLDHYKPIIEKTVANLITKAAAKGRFDFATEIAEPLPSTVLADLFRIPQEDRKRFYDAALTMTRFFGGAAEYNNPEGVKVNDASLFITDYFRDLIAKRRAEPQKDFFSVLLENQPRFQLTDDEIVAQAVMMLVAGQVTTTDQLNNNVFTMLETGTDEELRVNPSLIPAAIEEFNRLDPGVTYVFRTVKAPMNLGGMDLKPEDVVFISNHAVNRDPAAFANPDDCVPARHVNPHFAYGHGAHFCLGSRLARIQMQMCFEKLLALPGLALDPAAPAKRNHYALSFSGFETLPLTTTKETP